MGELEPAGNRDVAMTSTIISAEVLSRPHIQRLLGRSAMYEALALSLAWPMDETLARLDALLEDLAGHEVVAALGAERELEALRAARANVDAERLAPVHFVLFEGSVLCSPHETEYIRDPFAKAAQLADIAGFYAAFGLQVSTVNQTTPDDICTELEFMALVTRREAYAAVQDWDDRASVCRAASRTFMDAHLGRWIGAFTADLCEQAGTAAATRDDEATGTWFHAVAELLRVAVEADLLAQGVHPSRLHARVINDDTEAVPSCPLAIVPEPNLIDLDDEIIR
ncbi:MAG: hypothetical protein CVU47_04840 [Chloroflexi bacterium HGW-Chloroflexi-9]|nr:MAG: hypothetical protein CVU47_04840 [Chloroflexi bacterium HGW-Chloroflexi-9]